MPSGPATCSPRLLDARPFKNARFRTRTRSEGRIAPCNYSQNAVLPIHAGRFYFPEITGADIPFEEKEKNDAEIPSMACKEPVFVKDARGVTATRGQLGRAAAQGEASFLSSRVSIRTAREAGVTPDGNDLSRPRGML